MKRPIKRLFFFLMMIVLSVVVIETMAVALYSISNHEFYTKNAIKKRIRSNIGNEKGALTMHANSDRLRGDIVEVIHPYIGFVPDPNRNWGVSDYGFVSEKTNPVIKRCPGKIIVGILGGSFALGVCRFSSKELIGCLESKGREVVILNCSMGGYKQPQQLMILSYLLSLGAEFDIIINIDGFNEVALPPSENVPKGVFPFYPRQWDYRARDMIDSVEAKNLGYMELLKEKKGKWAKLFNDNKLYRSPTLSLLWLYRDKTLANKIYKIREEIERGKEASKLYVVSGPKYLYENEKKLYRDLADCWKRCSIQIKALCDANGIQYYHFLQPNQYVEGSKPISDEEKRIALREDHPYRLGVIKGYPFLRETGKELYGMGIIFDDLTMIFSDNDKKLYVDDCCHLGKEGYDIIVNEICETIKRNGIDEY